MRSSSHALLGCRDVVVEHAVHHAYLDRGRTSCGISAFWEYDENGWKNS